MGFFDTFLTFNQNVLLYVGSFILILSLLVFIHEFGHYIVAKWCGVKVESFSIGFGKELFGYNDRHGTRWKLSLVPLGGYVKLFGDSDPASAKSSETISDVIADATTPDEEAGVEIVRPMTPAERNVAFFAKPVWKRAAIVFAGPAINYIFAVLLMMGVFMIAGQPAVPPVAAGVIVDSNADKFGFEPNDIIMNIDGRRIKSFGEIRRAVMIALDNDTKFTVERDGVQNEFIANAEKVEDKDRFGFKNTRGYLGLLSLQQGFALKSVKTINGLNVEDKTLEDKIAAIKPLLGTTFTMGMPSNEEGGVQYVRIAPTLDDNQNIELTDDKTYGILFLTDAEKEIIINHGLASAFDAAIMQTVEVTTGTLRAIGQIVTGNRSAKELGGVVRIGAIAGDMVQQGVIAMLLFTALLSINLGLINLFPIPLLDGGHLVMYFFEAIMRRPVPERVQEYAFQAGFVFLIGLMVFTNLNDILQLIL